MVFGFDDYKGGLLYRYQRAQERVESLDTTVDVLRKRVAKLEKDLARKEGRDNEKENKERDNDSQNEGD